MTNYLQIKEYLEQFKIDPKEINIEHDYTVIKLPDLNTAYQCYEACKDLYRTCKINVHKEYYYLVLDGLICQELS